MSQNTFPYRRESDPLLVPVGIEPSRFDVPEDFFEGKTYTSFEVTNSNSCWVRLRGTSKKMDGSMQAFQPVEEHKGWLFPPGYKGVYSTQFPAHMSALAVARPGVPVDAANLVPLEITYGRGV